MSLKVSPRTSVVTQKAASIVKHADLKDNPLVRLGESIPWEGFIAEIVPDLQESAGPFYHLGRPLDVQLHLAIFLLQSLHKLTDRAVVEAFRFRIDYMSFAGLTYEQAQKAPDHTQVCRFRNRIKPETVQRLNVQILKLANQMQLTQFGSMDLDSTIQEANMAYPSDACLMKKLATKVMKVTSFLKERGHKAVQEVQIDMEKIAKKSKEYFFRAKNVAIEKTRKIFQNYYCTVSRQLKPAIQALDKLSVLQIKKLPWNIQLHLNQIRQHAMQYLKDVAFFIRTHHIKTTKILAFHVASVKCFTKGKVGKSKEFGRQFQIGRFTGNFLYTFACQDLTINDKTCLPDIIQQAREAFGDGAVREISTDKGYYSHYNVVELHEKMNLNTDGIQRPKTARGRPTNEKKAEELRKRRAGIEPLIGHLKSFGLGKSKMKSDKAAMLQAHRSAFAFNLSQIMHKTLKKVS